MIRRNYADGRVTRVYKPASWTLRVSRCVAYTYVDARDGALRGVSRNLDEYPRVATHNVCPHSSYVTGERK